MTVPRCLQTSSLIVLLGNAIAPGKAFLCRFSGQAGNRSNNRPGFASLLVGQRGKHDANRKTHLVRGSFAQLLTEPCAWWLPSLVCRKSGAIRLLDRRYSYTCKAGLRLNPPSAPSLSFVAQSDAQDEHLGYHGLPLRAERASKGDVERRRRDLPEPERLRRLPQLDRSSRQHPLLPLARLFFSCAGACAGHAVGPTSAAPRAAGRGAHTPSGETKRAAHEVCRFHRRRQS